MKSTLVQFALLPLLASCLSFKVYDKNEYCFTIAGNPGQYLHFSYMVRGRSEENVAFRLLNEGKEIQHVKQRELDVAE